MLFDKKNFTSFFIIQKVPPGGLANHNYKKLRHKSHVTTKPPLIFRTAVTWYRSTNRRACSAADILVLFFWLFKYWWNQLGGRHLNGNGFPRHGSVLFNFPFLKKTKQINDRERRQVQIKCRNARQIFVIDKVDQMSTFCVYVDFEFFPSRKWRQFFYFFFKKSLSWWLDGMDNKMHCLTSLFDNHF